MTSDLRSLDVNAKTAMQSLVGAWVGEGSGSYPDISPFQYLEETTITLAVEWNMLHVLQRTWRRAGDAAKGQALHLESGILLAKEDGSLVYSCGQDSGRAEVMAGTVGRTDDGRLEIEWKTFAHANDPRILQASRKWSVGAGSFSYEAQLSTVRTPEMRVHLMANLSRP